MKFEKAYLTIELVVAIAIISILIMTNTPKYKAYYKAKQKLEKMVINEKKLVDKI